MNLQLGEEGPNLISAKPENQLTSLAPGFPCAQSGDDVPYLPVLGGQTDVMLEVPSSTRHIAGAQEISESFVGIPTAALERNVSALGTPSMADGAGLRQWVRLSPTANDSAALSLSCGACV